MPCIRASHRLAPFVILFAPALAQAWPLGYPLYTAGGGPRDPFPPSYYGYNLDDQHPGYYGGGNYNEYYKFGRGWGFANFPDSLPYFPLPKPCVRWGSVPPPGYVDPTILPSLPVPITARVTVHVPAGAEVFIEGIKSKQTGDVRQFVSPPLAPDQVYVYGVRARWEENGAPVEQLQEVPVRAGAQAELIFPVPPARETLPAPKPSPSRN